MYVTACGVYYIQRHILYAHGFREYIEKPFLQKYFFILYDIITYAKTRGFVKFLQSSISPPIFIVFPVCHLSCSSTPEAEVLPQMHLSLSYPQLKTKLYHRHHRSP